MSEISPLRRRIMPSTKLVLHLQDEGGEKFIRSFKLSFDLNALCLVELRTRLSMLDAEIWSLNSPTNLSIMFWAAVLLHHPEYRGEEGLEVLRSYLDASNVGQVNDALNEAFIATLPKEKQEKIRAVQAERIAKGQDPTLPASEPEPTTAKPAAA